MAASEVVDVGGALGASLGDDVGGAELAAEVGARLVPPHQDDLLGAEPLGRQNGQQADGAVTDDGDAGALVDATLDCGVVAGAQHVGQGEQGRHQRGLLADRELGQGAVGQGDAW